MDRIHTMLYLYFDASQSKLKNRINDIVNRLLRSSMPVTYADLSELLKLHAQLEYSVRVERELYDMLK